MRFTRRYIWVLGAAMVLSACGSDGDNSATGGDDDSTDSATSGVSDGLANACSVDGCLVEIVGAEASGDDAIQVQFDANFGPDFSKNHIHLYWDTFTAAEVSSDAEANGLVQGDWTPTGEYPTFVTESATLISNRADSTTLCATAANKDHGVLDTTMVNCFDVADLLG